MFFIDYGNTESVDVSELFDLPESLLKYPCQVFEICHHIGVHQHPVVNLSTSARARLCYAG